MVTMTVVMVMGKAPGSDDGEGGNDDNSNGDGQW